jgi:hypothetical protein
MDLNMENVLALEKKKVLVKNSVLDLFAVAFIYLIPTVSHLFSYPFYIFDPMRMMLILAVAHSTKRNTFLLALSLPLISFIISAHPVFLKALLMTGELTINVFFFYLLQKKFSTTLLSMFASIIIAKVFYYAGKVLLVNFSFLKMDIVSTSILLQLIMASVFSVYVYLIWKNKTKKAS